MLCFIAHSEMQVIRLGAYLQFSPLILGNPPKLKSRMNLEMKPVSAILVFRNALPTHSLLPRHALSWLAGAGAFVDIQGATPSAWMGPSDRAGNARQGARQNSRSSRFGGGRFPHRCRGSCQGSARSFRYGSDSDRAGESSPGRQPQTAERHCHSRNRAVPDSFDAIAAAVSKRYQYYIWNARNRDPFAFDLSWHRWQTLDIPAMKAAAVHFIGEHDFASFTRPTHGRQNSIRCVADCSIAARGPRIVVGVEGSGFLWNMVRIMVGTLVEVGLGRYTPDDIPKMLAARDRRVGGSTAPPEGLYLQWVKTA